MFSGYPVLLGPVSLIVNNKAHAGCTLQICKQLWWNNPFCMLLPTKTEKSQIFFT